ncbi:hypothetical protein ACOBR2_05510 [Telmatobacter bradus]|uniref:hypothetical protein n=1 Tax=Telmatobacter bradus TaxID=474953 RepID=UPI003B43B44A
MGQFDSSTDAALSQLNFEELAKTPGGEFAEIIGSLLALCAVNGPISAASLSINILQKIRALAGASYTSNLIFVVTAIRDDLKDLYESHQELRERIENLPKDPRFAEAVASAALRAMHTSVKDRLKRLARILVNGVKEDDLEAESLDDMMRAAVELKKRDVEVLAHICKMQITLFEPKELKRQRNERTNHIQRIWQVWWNENSQRYAGQDGVVFNGSCVRLHSLGLIVPLEGRSHAAQPTSSNYELLYEGKKFYERLQEIAVEGTENAM